MAFFRIECPAYFNTRMNAPLPANTFHVNGDKARDLRIAQMENQGARDVVAVEISAEDYLAVAMAKIGRQPRG